MAARPPSPEAAAHDLLPREEPLSPPEEPRIDADKALAELEAELFAAAKQVDSDATIPHAERDRSPTSRLPAMLRAAPRPSRQDQPAEPVAALHDAETPEKEAAPAHGRGRPDIAHQARGRRAASRRPMPTRRA